MGAYEDRYPDSYGRGEQTAQATPLEELQQATPPRQVRDATSTLRARFGLRAPVERRSPSSDKSPTWRHQQSAPDAPAAPLSMIEPQREAALLRQQTHATGSFRGIGPRGYIRSPERIYEDVCDRLTEDAFIDASDIEVSVTGAEVTLDGSVNNPVAIQRAEAIAADVTGVRQVHNHLIVHRAVGLRG